MAFAQGSNSRIAYGIESTFGTAASTYTTLPINTSSLNMTKNLMTGNQLLPDRMPRTERHGTRQIAGDIVADLCANDFDDLIRSAMLSDWSTNVIKVGTTPVFLTIEDYASNIDQARLFTGCSVNSMAISLAPDQMVTTTFGLVGKDMVISATEKTASAPSGNVPFDAYSGNLAIGNVGGSSSVAIVTAFDFNITNSFGPTNVIGENTTPSLEYGRAVVSGSFTAYFENDALINRFINETATEIEVSVDDPLGSNPYTFLFPQAKINSADVSLDGPMSRSISVSFSALYNATEGSNLVITRTS